MTVIEENLRTELRQCAEALTLSRKQHAEDYAELERLRAIVTQGNAPGSLEQSP